MKIIFASLVLIAASSSIAASVNAGLEGISISSFKNNHVMHSGRTRQSDGCHIDHSTGLEHCH